MSAEILTTRDTVTPQPKLYAIPNHSSSTLTGYEVEELLNLPPRPEFPSKQAMLEWSHADSTDHCYYSAYEPRNPGLRLSKDNPVAYCHGLVADFDTVLTRGETLKACEKLAPEFKPAYVSTTFSKGSRVVWLFARKLPMFDGDMAKKVLTKLVKDIKITKYFPGFDEKSIDPTQYFELGTDWQEVSTNRISSTILSALVFAEMKKAKVDHQGPAIPLEEIAAEVERQFPGRWQGAFEVGRQGVRFWDKEATNTTGAWIRETGVFAFTGEGRFMPWGEVLGQEFVRRYEQNRIGGAIKGTFHDGRQYWVRTSECGWVDKSTEIMKRRLAVAGLRNEQRRGENISEIGLALATIEENARVDGAFPFLYRADETLFTAGRRYLNVSRIQLVRPAEKYRPAWGDGFPWLKSYLEQIFDPQQLQIFLSWLSHFYASALDQKLRKGQALFIAGPSGIGKTFLAQRVIGDLMGGTAEATNFLLGKTEFNSEMYESPCWTIDDAVANADGKAHEAYSQIIKKVVANFSMTYRRMYFNPVTLPWEGRVIVTLNDDPESIAMLPNVEQSMLDKVIFLKASQTKVDFNGAEAKVACELPFLAAFLRDYETPPELVGDYRYGVKSYHHPELLQSAKDRSSTSSFADLLYAWRGAYFRQCTEPQWKGTAFDLHLELLATETIKPIVAKSIPTHYSLGKNLSKLMQQGSTWVQRAPRNPNKDIGQEYIISNPDISVGKAKAA